MKSMIFLFFMISLGTMVPLSISGATYNFQFVEFGMFVVFFGICLKSWKEGIIIERSGKTVINYLAWLLCFAYALLTFYWSTYGITVIASSLGFLYGAIAFFVSSYFYKNNPNAFKVGNRVLILSLLFQLVYNMAQGWGQGLSFYFLKNYATTLLGDSNYISFFFTFGLIYEFISKEKRWKTFVILNLAGLILTISRGAIYAFVASLAVYFIFAVFNKKTKKVKLIKNLLLLVFVFYLFIKFTPPGQNLWLGLQDGIGASSINSRELLWSEAIRNIKDNPMGNGVVWMGHPHNIILASIRDLGIIVGTIYFILVSYPIFNFLKPKTFSYSNKTMALLIAYLSVFIHALVEVFYSSSSSIIWTAMTLSFISKSIKDEENKNASEYSENCLDSIRGIHQSKLIVQESGGTR